VLLRGGVGWLVDWHYGLPFIMYVVCVLLCFVATFVETNSSPVWRLRVDGGRARHGASFPYLAVGVCVCSTHTHTHGKKNKHTHTPTARKGKEAPSSCFVLVSTVCWRPSLPANALIFKTCGFFSIVTPVAGWILRKETLSSNLQARFCKLITADFVCCNWVIRVNAWFPKNGNQGSLYLYTMPEVFFLMGRSVKSPCAWRCNNAPDPLWKNSGGGGFELNETQTNPES